MQYSFPVKDAKTGFAELELLGMQALASGDHKKAKECYDRVVLADPTKETLYRVVRQYESAGLLGSVACSGYYVMACHREKIDKGQSDQGSFQYALGKMRKRHAAYLKSQHQIAVMQSTVQSHRRPCRSNASSPPYDESATEQTALLKKGKPIQ